MHENRLIQSQIKLVPQNAPKQFIMKNAKLIALLLFSIVALFNCDKEEKLQFGITETGFEVDTLYKASIDGLLVIQTAANIVPAVVGHIYADEYIDSTTIIGTLQANDNATYPIKKNYYWRVTKKAFSDSNVNVSMNISWTPMN